MKKLSSSLLILFLCCDAKLSTGQPILFEGQAYGLVDYGGIAHASLSSNVNWLDEGNDPQSVLDGLTDLASPFVAYQSDTCSATFEDDDGFVVFDMGSPVKIDAVRVFVEGSSKSCSGVSTSELPISTAALPAVPTTSPTTAPTIDVAATVAALFDPAVQGRPKGQKARCHTCRGPTFICERSHASEECGDEAEQYCIVQVENLIDGSRYVKRGCATEQQCHDAWYGNGIPDMSPDGLGGYGHPPELLGTDPRCANYDVDDLKAEHFGCGFCCYGDNCNDQSKPDVGPYKGSPVVKGENSVCFQSVVDDWDDIHATAFFKPAERKATICPSDKPYCVYHAKHDDSLVVGTKFGCASESQCEAWLAEYGKSPMCKMIEGDEALKYHDFANAYEHYLCHYCCKGDLCNRDFAPPDNAWVYKQDTDRKMRSLASNGQLQELIFPLEQRADAQFIKYWATSSTGGAAVKVHEIQPLVKSIVKEVSGKASGDPHFRTFGGQKYDFHGGCSLVLLQNAGFANGSGLTIQIRTVVKTWWSYISAAVIQIGGISLEVRGSPEGEGPRYWINGVPGESEGQDPNHDVALKGLEAEVESIIPGFRIEYIPVSSKQHKFRLALNRAGDAISFETFKDWVAINVGAKSKQFEGTLGLMGAYPSGALIARDQTTVMEDTDAFGKEWQVRDTEPMLFHIVEGPQYPESCHMPSSDAATGRKKRRLGEGAISEEQAAVVCAHAYHDDLDGCVFDVLATNDVSTAGAY